VVEVSPGERFKVDSIYRENEVKLTSIDSTNTRTLPMIETFQKRFETAANDNKNNDLPFEAKLFAMELHSRGTELKQNQNDCKKQIRGCKTYLIDLKSKLKTHQDQAKRWTSLEANADTHIGPSIERKIACQSSRRKEAERKLQLLEAQKESTLESLSDVIKFMNDLFGFIISKSSIYSWTKDGIKNLPVGRPVVMSTELEEDLAKAVLKLDEYGFSMNKRQLKALARAAVEVSEYKQSFGPEEKWFKRWFERMTLRFPKWTKVKLRSTSCNTIKWFNTENVHWWFGSCLKVALQYDFARPSAPEEYEHHGEIYWLTPERVIVTDESCVNGGLSRNGQKPKEVVLCSIDNLEMFERGAPKRRGVPSNNRFDEHITLIGGMNFVGKNQLHLFM